MIKFIALQKVMLGVTVAPVEVEAVGMEAEAICIEVEAVVMGKKMKNYPYIQPVISFLVVL